MPYANPADRKFKLTRHCAPKRLHPAKAQGLCAHCSKPAAGLRAWPNCNRLREGKTVR